MTEYGDGFDDIGRETSQSVLPTAKILLETCRTIFSSPPHHPKLYFGEDQVQAELNLVRAGKHLKSVPSSSESSWLRKLFYNPLGYWYNTFQGFVYIYKKLWCKIFTQLSVSVCIAYKYLYLKRLYLKSLMLNWEFTISGNLNCMASMNQEKPILV